MVTHPHAQNMGSVKCLISALIYSARQDIIPKRNLYDNIPTEPEPNRYLPTRFISDGQLAAQLQLTSHYSLA